MFPRRWFCSSYFTPRFFPADEVAIGSASLSLSEPSTPSSIVLPSLPPQTGTPFNDCPHDQAVLCPINLCDDSPFDRVVVSYLTRGFTSVSFQLLPTFLDPRPLTAQLQVGRTANPNADDWLDVGLPVVDQVTLYDPDQRAFGKTNFTHYRIKLTTPLSAYYSLPVGAQGILDRRAWRLAREIVRQRLVAYRYGPGAQRGYLLKRRRTGEPCHVCLDHQTREVRNPDCPSCYGTGFECGYYFPLSCTWAEMTPTGHHTHLDPTRGTVDDVVVQAEMLMTELLSEEDIFVSAKTDVRYYVHDVKPTAEMRGVPLIADVVLKPVAFSSIVYAITIPDQLQQLGLS